MASTASRPSSSSSWSTSNQYPSYPNLDPDVEREFKRQAALSPLEREQEIFNRVVHYSVAERFEYIRNQTRPPFHALTLPKQTKLDMNCYLGHDERKIVVSAKKESKEIQAFQREETVRVLKKDAATNTKVMIVSILIFGGLGSLAWLASPLGGMIGTPVGVGAGVLVGGLVIKHLVNEQVNIAIELSDHYTVWKTYAIASKIYAPFRNFIDADTVFGEFLCPISKDICTIPVKSPNGHIYNQEAIYKYIEEFGKGDPKVIECPLRGDPFGMKELTVDSNYCQRLIIKAREVSLHILQIGRENELKHGVDAVVKNTMELMDNISDKLISELSVEYNRRVREGKTTREKADKDLTLSVSQWNFRNNEVASNPVDLLDIIKDFFS